MIIEKLLMTRSIEGVDMKYTYSINKEMFNNVQAYGIKIERVDIKDGVIINRVEDEVEHISNKYYKVKGLLNMLYKNKVSPIHLVDIIGEYVDTWVNDFEENNSIVNIL